MSWLDLKVWLKEQNDILLHSYIDNLYYIPEESLLLMKLYNSSKSMTYWLVIEPSKRISISLSDLSLETYPENAQKVWRSLLKNCYIIGTSQVLCERILYITLDCRSAIRKIVAEFLPRGSICVLGEDDRILLCSKYRHMKDRELRPGLGYTPPPSQRLCMNLPDILHKTTKRTDVDVVRTLIKEFETPPEIAETIAVQCSVKDKKMKDLLNSEILCLATAYRDIINIVENKWQACIVYDRNDMAIGFYPYTPTQFANYKIEYYSTLNDAINKYYEDEFREILLSTYLRDLKNDIRNMERALNRIDNSIQELKKKLEEFKEKLKVVDENYVHFEQIHKCILEVVKSYGWDKIKSCGDIYDASPSIGIYRIKYGDVILEFDIKKSFIENYNDARKAVANIIKSIDRAEKERDNIVNKLQELYKQMKHKEKKISCKVKKVKEWYESYIWYITSNGFLVIGGKDASQNMKIIRRLLDVNDIVLHTDIHGASTVVIKTYGKNVNNDDVKEAALIAACYSKAWKMKLMSVDVFWARGSQISLSPPSGEFLPKGSYMIYGERNYVRNVELKLAIGVEVLDENFVRISVGPEEVMNQRAIAYFVIIPGDDEPQTIAYRFIEFLKSRNLEDIALVIDVNDIAKKVPGRSKVVKLVAKYKV